MGEDLRMLARLNIETQPHHCDADGDVDAYLFRTPVTAQDYRMYLCRAYGFVVPVERALVAAPGLEEVVDLKSRAKTSLLVHDLLALGMMMDEILALPVYMQTPVFRGPAAALGWMYVIERPLLSASVLRGQLARFLPAEMAYASAYFNCYRGQAGTMWRELGESMDRVAYSQAVADLMVVAAHDGFRALSRWRRAASERPQFAPAA